MSVSATEFAHGDSFEPDNPSHVHGGVGEFSDVEAEHGKVVFAVG